MPENSHHSIISGLLIGFAAAFIVLGSLATALAEGAVAGDIPLTIPPSPAPRGEKTATPEVIAEPSLTQPVQVFLPGSPSATMTKMTVTVIAASARASICPPPGGWYVITVEKGDTLTNLAKKYDTSVETLAQANCFSIDTEIHTDTVIYVPGPPSPATESCNPPSGWIQYSIQPGDTLGLLAQKAGTTAQKIQEGNCLGNSTNIRVGQIFYIPSLFGTATPAHWFTATPYLWVSPTSMYTYPSATYDPFATQISTPVYPTPIPFASLTPLAETPQPSITSPVEVYPWPSDTSVVVNTPWPSATSSAE